MVSALQPCDEVGLKQNELAKKLTWSAAVLSRVENGDRALAAEELQTVLDGIGTADALKLRRYWSASGR
ncbi:helix-turn-helix domain-containing protein [Luteimonas fraxinea]|uniref:helix-turn-helix domain-containing protein n=1 Tax=Luteimonas fraxinea TaxID=2901869 RepID=UPI003CCCE37D